MSSQQPVSFEDPFLQLMGKAKAHAAAHGSKYVPALSPIDVTVLNGQVPVAELQSLGIQIVPWTTNEPDTMRAIIRTGVDGLISDRPDLLQRVLAEERDMSPEAAARLKNFVVSGHRGARGLRPENTLPAFESGLDNLIDQIETDTGVSADHVSLIWHDQFYNPQSCRKADGSPYTMENRIFLSDISSHEAQATLICDKLHFGADQKNDLALSPVAVAFAKQERLISPYVPTYVEQVFRFTAFYAAYYRSGPGKLHPNANERAAAADRVHFNIETKIHTDAPLPAAVLALSPPAKDLNHTVSPQLFVTTLCDVIQRNHMESRSDIQSFDFRTLILVEEQCPNIQTFYLTEAPRMFSTEYLSPSSSRRNSPCTPS
jgi:glycerophosphoryl diester phosphodiesterase